MQSQGNRGKLLPSKDGFACCPYCGKKLLKVTASTEATRLPLRCRQCKRELIIDIHRGQSFQSQSPDD